MLSGNSQHIHDELLHFMKSNPFPKFFKEFLIVNCEAWCPFIDKEEINPVCYRTHPQILEIQAFLKRYLLYNQFLASNRYYCHELRELLEEFKSPEIIYTYENFQENVDNIIHTLEILDKNIQDKIRNLTCEECIRLDEAIVDYSNNCLKSSIIMAISAIELRLHRMIKNLDNNLYKKKFENATLGNIAKQFSDNGEYEDIKKLLPKKHLPLLLLLNKYRIFTVHPKNEQITPTIADSILALSFVFITDPEIRVYDEEELLCDSEEIS